MEEAKTGLINSFGVSGTLYASSDLRSHFDATALSYNVMILECPSETASSLL